MKAGYIRASCFDPDDVYVRLRAWTNLVPPAYVTKTDDVITLKATDKKGTEDILSDAVVFYEVRHTNSDK